MFVYPLLLESSSTSTKQILERGTGFEPATITLEE
jgi:hypothetical protein